MPWHITEATNNSRILNEGLKPAIGPRSALVNEDQAKVHLFATIADIESAGWLEDVFDEDTRLALFFVSDPDLSLNPDGLAWIELTEAVPANRIELVSLDLMNSPSLAYYAALDRSGDPFRNLEDFRATKTEMPASDYGELVGDGQFEDDDSTFIVYGAGWRIERLEDGRLMLPFYQDSVIGTEADLPELEKKLFDFVQEENPPRVSADESPDGP